MLHPLLLSIYWWTSIRRTCTVSFWISILRINGWLITVFNPDLLFNTLNKSFLLQAFQSPFDISIVSFIRKEFSSWTSVAISNDEPTARIHMNNIQKMMSYWARLKSNNTCLTCLRQKPKYILSCEHSLCEICIQIFEDKRSFAECQFHLQACVLCAVENITVILKPPTAGIKILTIDGKGIREVISLKFLEML